MSKIDKKKIKEIALLARLNLTESETGKFQKELSKTLDYIEIIQGVETKDIEPLTQVRELSNVFRADEKHSSDLTRDEILFNAPEKKDGYIKVKSVLD